MREKKKHNIHSIKYIQLYYVYYILNMLKNICTSIFNYLTNKIQDF